VRLFDQASISHHQYTPVVFGPNQPARALLERNGGLGQLELDERVATTLATGLDARLYDGVIRRRKRQFVDGHQCQGVTRHIDAFPEACTSYQHHMLARAKRLEQFAPGAIALLEQGPVPLALGKDVAE